MDLLWQPLILSVQLAGITTIVLIVIATPIAWWLSQTASRWKPLVQTTVALPIVLPPTVLGFYLLLLLSPDGLPAMLGSGPLAFTFTGLVIGSVVYSLPFVVQPLQDSFAAIGRRPMEVAATLGATPTDRFFTVALPLARPGYLTAAALGFAHTLGEFGVVLMIGGNIPGETQVLSIAIYDHVEALAYDQAHTLAALLLTLSFLILLGVYAVNRNFRMIRT